MTRLAFAVTACAAVLVVLEVSKVNVLLEPIAVTLDASPSALQLVVSLYVLAFGLVLIPAGRVGDLWSKRGMLVLGLAAFSLGSGAIAVAATSEVMVAGRVVQGIGAGVVMPQVLGLVQHFYSGAARGTALGVLGAAIGIGSAAGPIVSGVFVSAFGADLGWRAAFAMNVVVGLVLLGLVLAVVSAPQERAPASGFDVVGVFLLGATVLGVMLPFVFTTGTEEDVPWRWFSLILATATGIGFIAWERRLTSRGAAPLLDFSLFAAPSFRYGIAISTLFLFAVPAALLIITLFLMVAQSHSALVAAAATVPYMVAAAGVALLVGRMTQRHATALITAGLVVFSAGLIGVMLALQFATTASSPAWIGSALAVSGVGAGAVLGPNQWRALSDVRLTEAGLAGSIMQMGQRIGNAIGTAVCLSIWFATSGGGDNVALDPSRHGAQLSLTVVAGATVAAFVLAMIDWRRSRSGS